MGCVGSKHYGQSEYAMKAEQDPEYVEYIKGTIPRAFCLRLEKVDGRYVWVNSATNRAQPADVRYLRLTGRQKEEVGLSYLEADDFKFTGVNSYTMAAGAFTGDLIIHILDGYSTSINMQIARAPGDSLMLILAVTPYEHDVEQYEAERSGAKLIAPGMFVGQIPWWQKAFTCGRLWCLACGDHALKRNTAHQPIYLPTTNSSMLAAPNDWPAFAATIDSDGFMQLTDRAWTPKMPDRYTILCMHPCTDPHRNLLLTYSFKHTVVKNEMEVTFYEVSDKGKKNTQRAVYKFKGNAVLHQFGFTENYFVLFASPLRLNNGGQCCVLFGKPVMRVLDDEFTADLIIHFIPRPSSQTKARKLRAFDVNTRLQGWVYHTINCFERQDKDGMPEFVVDAFVSNLNAQREASQFELNFDHPVYDDHGDIFRFICRNPLDGDQTSCRISNVASLIDYSIDFHCINALHAGREYRYLWLVGYERLRNENGIIVRTESKIWKVDVTKAKDVSVVAERDRDDWTHSRKTYVRTPMFVANAAAGERCREDDGYVFCWAYELDNHDKVESQSPATVLCFDAEKLENVLRIGVPKEFYVPYSVHSWIHPGRTELPGLADWLQSRPKPKKKKKEKGYRADPRSEEERLIPDELIFEEGDGEVQVGKEVEELSEEIDKIMELEELDEEEFVRAQMERKKKKKKKSGHLV